jgi:alkanesulfonate monooxygenase SsuD/methylene tetrahydromethanopterin reductase-like flavin-dependent oxidoreductase (luciferase family)
MMGHPGAENAFGQRLLQVGLTSSAASRECPLWGPIPLKKWGLPALCWLIQSGPEDRSGSDDGERRVRQDALLAIVVLPWHNPVLLAEEAATLDMLSEGRLDLGIGKGYRYTEFKGFGIPIGEADTRFEEALTILVKSWTTADRFSYRGRFWTFDDIVVEPKPYQKPHPPLWMGAASEASIRRVAERRCNLLLDQYASVEAHAERSALFRAEVERCGSEFDPMSVVVARNLYVARNDADRESALERYRRAQQRILAVSLDPNRSGGSHILRYDDADTENSMLYGTPEAIARKLDALGRAGIRYVLLNIGGLSRDSLRTFAREVMPAFTTD